MKIIDSRKDFYDYVVGQFGIDKDVVLDRRKYDTIEYYLRKNPDSPLRWFFNDMPSPNINDSYQEIYDGRYKWQFPFFVDYKKFIGKPLGKLNCLVVELGFRRWIFCVERYKSYESGKIIINVIGIIDCNISANDKILPNRIEKSNKNQFFFLASTCHCFLGLFRRPSTVGQSTSVNSVVRLPTLIYFLGFTVTSNVFRDQPQYQYIKELNIFIQVNLSLFNGFY